MKSIIKEETIEKIRDSIDLVDIVSRYLPLKKIGSNYTGLCPFHSEKTPSFTVSETKQLFHCFGCGEGGDLFTFIMKMENLTFVETIKFLGDLYGISIDIDNTVDDKLLTEKKRIYEINREAAKFYYYHLINSQKPKKYLKDRKLGRNVINKFGLGYAPDRWDSILNYLREKGYKIEDIEKAGLIGRRKDNTGYYDKFRNRIIFPIIDTKDRVIGFGGRVLDSTMPKYLNSQDTLVFTKGNNLYGLNLVRKFSDKKRIILVEGYMDVISLFNNGINYVVASLGTAFTQNQAKLLKRYGKEVYICYDSDKAGINATIKTINILRSENIDPKIIVLPPNHDPDDFIKGNGLKEFENLLDKALNHIDYKISINKQKYNLSNIEDKIKFTKKVSEILKELKSPIEKDVYIDKVSMDTGISKEAIQKEVLGRNFKINTSSYKDKYINAKYRDNKNKIAPIKTVLESAHLTAEKTLVKLMTINKDYYHIVKNHLSRENFLNYECNILVNIIYDAYEKNEQLVQLEPEYLISKIEIKDDYDSIIIDEIMGINIDFLPEDKSKLIDDLIKTIKYSNLKVEREETANKIREIESKKDKDKGDVDKLRSLCLKLTELDKELKSHI